MLHTTRTSRPARRTLPLLAAALLLATAPAAAAAQDGFLFRQPGFGLTFKVGPLVRTVSSDVFDDMRHHLTLDRGDFTTTAFGLDMVLSPSRRLDIVIGGGFAESEARSEFRDWIGDDGLPIEQTTRLRTTPVTASLRYHLLPRGRSIGTMAWLPRSVTPYVGGGAGVTYYELLQEGEFVDFRDNRIFEAAPRSDGMAFTTHALAGADYWLTGRYGLNAEVRYTYGGADATDGFRTFDRIDVGGFQLTLGFSARW